MREIYTVKLLDGKSFKVNKSETILDASLKNNIHLAYSCKDGRCGVCKTRVIKGETNEIIESSILNKEERKRGFILTCVTAASSDIEISAEDLFYLSEIETRLLPCKIDKINKLNKEIMSVILRFPPNSNFKYLPGQYITLTDPSGNKRSYSISSYKDRHNNKIELIIKVYQDGILSNYFLNIAKKDDLMRLEGPLGTFFLRDARPNVDVLIFIATGSGIAPVKAMLEKIEEEKLMDRYKEVYVYYGTRYRKDMFFNCNDFLPDGVVFRTVFSREGGDFRYVQDAVLDDFKSFHRVSVYACGSQDMIKSSSEQFFNKGLDPKLFFSDAFLVS